LFRIDHTEFVRTYLDTRQERDAAESNESKKKTRFENVENEKWGTLIFVISLCGGEEGTTHPPPPSPFQLAKTAFEGEGVLVMLVTSAGDPDPVGSGPFFTNPEIFTGYGSRPVTDASNLAEKIQYK
jgi:hypothetical protein